MTTEFPFDVRVHRMSEALSPGAVIAASGITVSRQGQDSAVLNLTVSRRIVGDLTGQYVLVKYQRPNGSWAVPRDAIFTLGEDSDDTSVDDEGMVTLTGTLTAIDRLAHSFIDEVEGTDGQMEFANASAGGVMAVLLAARPELGITRTFTPTQDSLGNAWPTGDFTDHTFAALTNVQHVLAQLAGGQFCEWHTEGMELVLKAFEVGENLAGGAYPTFGPGATVNTRRSLTDTASEFIVVSDVPGVPWQRVTRPELGLGPRQAIVTVSGAANAESALRLATPYIDAASRPKLEVSASYRAGDPLPMLMFEDFNLGDQLRVRNRDTEVPRRLTGYQITSKGDATGAGVRLVFGDRFLSTTAKLARRVVSLTVGSVGGAGGSGAAIGNTPPTAEPLAPSGLAAASNVGAFRANGAAYATVTLDWDEVTESASGGQTLVSAYEVWERTDTSDSVPSYTTDVSHLVLELSGPTRYYKVRAFNGRWSSLSDEIAVTPALPTQITTPLAAPTVTSAAGNALIVSDGLLAGGGALPTSYQQTFAEYRWSESDPWVRHPIPARGAGQVALVRGTPGDTLYASLVWVDTLGRVSDRSASASVTIAAIAEVDLPADVLEAIDNAGTAATSADRKLTVSSDAPEPSDGAGRPTGAIWFRRSTEGLIGAWEWDGDSWEARPLQDAMLGSLSAEKINAGYLDVASRVQAGSIATSKLLVASTENHLYDPSFDLNSPQGWVYNNSVNEATNARLASGRAMKVSTTTSAFIAATNLAIIPVEADDEYLLSAWVRLDAGTSAGLGIAMRVRYAATEAGVATGAVSADTVTTPAGTGTSYVQISGAWKVPAGAKFARVEIISRDTTAGKVYRVDDCLTLKRNGGKLIVDGEITAGKLNVSEIWANSAWLGVLRAGVIEADMVVPGFGDDLNLAANGSILLVAGQIAENATSIAEQGAQIVAIDEAVAAAGEAAGAAEGTAAGAATAAAVAAAAAASAQERLDEMAMYYRFTTDGAIIGREEDPYTLVLRNNGVSIEENGVPVSWWDSGQMIVPRFVGEEVALANHKIEQYGSRTVVRAL